MKTQIWTWGLIAGLCFIAGTAYARSFRINQIPNAPASCNTCHTAGGGTPRNAFGQEVERTLVGVDVDWGPALAMMDSDGDGFTNGEELGDPDGTWRPGDPNPQLPAYNPGVPTSAPACGNDILDPLNNEVCDGSDLGGETCETQGFAFGGTLGCLADCSGFDTSACNSTPPPDAGFAPDGATGMPDGGVTIVDSGVSTGGGPDEEDDAGCECVCARPTRALPSLGLLAMGLVVVGLARRREPR